MREPWSLIWMALVGLFRSRASLAAEILADPQYRGPFDLAGLYRLAPTVLNALAIVKPETVIKWHRAGFRSYWSWKSRRGGGRPTVPPEIRKLIREMSIANPLWGAPRIHGELLKLGIDDRRAWPNICSKDENPRRKVGRRSCAITLTGSLRWICSSCRQSRFAGSMDC